MYELTVLDIGTKSFSIAGKTGRGRRRPLSVAFPVEQGVTGRAWGQFFGDWFPGGEPWARDQTTPRKEVVH